MQVLTKGLEIGRLSGGAFDIGVGRLVNAWGFGAAGSIPDKEAIQAALHDRLPPTHTVLELDAPEHGRASMRSSTSTCPALPKGLPWMR